MNKVIATPEEQQDKKTELFKSIMPVYSELDAIASNFKIESNLLQAEVRDLTEIIQHFAELEERMKTESILFSDLAAEKSRLIGVYENLRVAVSIADVTKVDEVSIPKSATYHGPAYV